MHCGRWAVPFLSSGERAMPDPSFCILNLIFISSSFHCPSSLGLWELRWMWQEPTCPSPFWSPQKHLKNKYRSIQILANHASKVQSWNLQRFDPWCRPTHRWCKWWCKWHAVNRFSWQPEFSYASFTGIEEVTSAGRNQCSHWCTYLRICL